MDEYAQITYKEVQILLEIGNRNSFFPYSNLVKPLTYFPDYVEGIANLEGTISLVIDLSEFLGLNYPDRHVDFVFLQVNHQLGDFALKVPIPKIIAEDINLRASRIQDDLTIKLPSSRYYASGNATYLVVSIDHFIDYLASELSDILFDAWLQSSPKWDGDTLKQAPSNTKTSIIAQTQRSEFLFSKSGEIDQNIIVARTGNHQFLIEEKQIVDIILENNPVSPIPNSTYWTRGVMSYQNESLIAINFSKYLDIPSDNDDKIDIIIESNHGRIVIDVDNVESKDMDELNPVFTRDFDISTIPYSNIYSDNSRNVYYKINTVGFIESILERKEPSLEWSNWQSFFQRDRIEYEQSDRYLMGELASLNALSAYIGNLHMIIPQENVELLTTGDNYKYYDGVRFVSYDNSWIPSLDLNAWIDAPQTELIYSTIVSSGDTKFEIRSENAVMNHRELTVMSEDDMNKLAPSTRQIGITQLASTRLGLGFDLNFDTMGEVLSNVKSKSGHTIAELTEIMNKTFPHEVKKEEATEEISGAWDENARLFLFTEIEGETKIAYPTAEIDQFLIESEEEVIPWEYPTSSKHFFLVKINDPNSEGIIYQIPSNSYLLSVAKESIKEDSEGDFISLKKERVPIRSFKNTRK